MAISESAHINEEYGNQLERAQKGQTDLHVWSAGPEARFGAGFMQLALRESGVGELAPEPDLSGFRDYDPKYCGVMSAEDVAAKLQSHKDAVAREANLRDSMLSSMFGDVTKL